MIITINKMNFLFNLFSNYKDKIYTYMRKNNYRINEIMNFINGYMLVEDKIAQYTIDVEMENNSVAERFETMIFNNYTELLKIVDEKIIYSIKYMEYDYEDEWEKIGVKYALNLIKFYLENVLSGYYNEISDDLYISIPDKDNPDSYDWEEHGGFDINI